MSKVVKAKQKLVRSLIKGRDATRTMVLLTKSNKKHPPGQHGAMALSRGGQSDYGVQRREIKLLQVLYNIREKQLHLTFKKARKLKGDTAENMVALLESRVDMVVFRSGYAKTIYHARQLVSHKHIMVNGKKVNIPSLRVKPGDVISLTDKAKKLQIIEDSLKLSEDNCEYLDIDKAAMQTKFIRIPSFSEVPYPVEVHMSRLVEFYSH